MVTHAYPFKRLTGLMLMSACVACEKPSTRSSDPSVLETVMRMLPSEVVDVSPVLLHPHRLMMYGPDDPTPGVRPEHYSGTPWPDLLSAANRSGIPLCEVNQKGGCFLDAGSPGAGFVALTTVSYPAPDSAEVWLVANEMRGAGRFYEVGLRVEKGEWVVTGWRPRGSWN